MLAATPSRCPVLPREGGKATGDQGDIPARDTGLGQQGARERGDCGGIFQHIPSHLLVFGCCFLKPVSLGTTQLI